MVTPFVPSPASSGRVSLANSGPWLILRPADPGATLKPWGRLEAWLDRRRGARIGYRFQLLYPDSDAADVLAESAVSTSAGGKLSVDLPRGPVAGGVPARQRRLPPRPPLRLRDVVPRRRRRPAGGGGGDAARRVPGGRRGVRCPGRGGGAQRGCMQALLPQAKEGVLPEHPSTRFISNIIYKIEPGSRKAVKRERAQRGLRRGRSSSQTGFGICGGGSVEWPPRLQGHGIGRSYLLASN